MSSMLEELRFLPIRIGVNWEDEKLKMDILRWKQICGIDGNERQVLARLLHRYPEFRNLFVYRNRFRKSYYRWVRLWYKPMNTLYIQSNDIGGGLFIQHGFATIISAEKMGENCWVNQQVTIGYNGKGRAPIIGDGVMITCGAKVLGPITVGDNVVIGANAVVIRDVESGITVGGVPAHKLK